MRRTNRYAFVCLTFLVLFSIVGSPQRAAFFREARTVNLEATPAESASLRTKLRSHKRPSKPRTETHDNKESANPPGSARQRVGKCANSELANVIRKEYGAIFVVNTQKVLVPSDCVFRNSAEVERFQRRAGVATAIVGGIRIELQPEALESFLKAHNEARKQKITLTPRGTDASRRSYAKVASLWRERFDLALAHWVEKGKIAPKEAARLRSLDSTAQTLEVLRLEEKRLLFGKGFNKSILESTAPPGTSQHLSMLALDIEQHSDPAVRAIMAKHGWFQTIRNDEPHFTFLGVSEAELPALGLRKLRIGNRTVWVLNPADSAKGAEPVYDHQREPVIKSPAKTSYKTPGGAPIFKALSGRYYSMSPSVLMTENSLKRARQIAAPYFAQTGRRLYFTSIVRTPERQSNAMYGIIKNHGAPYFHKVYHYSRPARQIFNAYFLLRRNPSAALKAMTSMIESQIAQGVFISGHLRETAFDVRLNANRKVLQKTVNALGGRVGREKDHYHIGFNRP